MFVISDRIKKLYFNFCQTSFWLFLLLAGWSLLLCFWFFQHTIRGGGMPCWDGWERCAKGANIWYDIRHLDFVLFWNHTNAQVVWPFLHSWVTGTLFVLFGPSLETARLVTLFSFFGSGIIILLYFIKRDNPFAWIAGCISWALFTTSPLVIQHAASIMSELPGLFLVLLVLFFWPEEGENNHRKAILAGIFMGLLFLYKYNYAFLTYFSLILAVFFREHFNVRKLFSTKYELLFGLPLAMLFLWLLPDLSRKVEGLVGFALNNPNVRMPFNLSFLLFYPKRVPLEYFSSPFLAIASVILFLIALFISKKLRLNNLVLACFLVHFLAAVLHPMKDTRFMFIPMGLFFVLTGESIEELLKRIFPVVQEKKQSLLLLFLIPVLVPLAIYQTYTFRQSHISKEKFFLAPIQTIINHTDKDNRIAFLISHDQLSPPAISYYLTIEKDMIQSREDGSLSRWNYLFLFKSGEAVRSESIEERFKQLEYYLYIYKANKIITVQSTAPWSIQRFDELFGGNQEYAELVPQLEKYSLDFERDFKQTHSRVRVFTLEASG